MKIAYEAADGRVHVLSPALMGKTLREWMDAYGHKSIPAGARNVTLVEDAPGDRSERHMWAIENGRVVVRNSKAAAADWSQPHPLEAQLRASIEALERPVEPAPWSLKDLMRRAETPEPEAAPPPPEPAAAPAIEYEPSAHSPELPSFERSEPPVPTLPMPIEAEPPALPLPVSLPPPPVLEDHRASDVVVTDAERKRQAVERVSFAVMRVGDAQIRYEIAVQADNGNTDALEMLQPEAAVYRMPASALAKQIIAQRTLQEQRVMRAYAAKARALLSIESAIGTEIDDVAEAYVHEIMEEGDAGVA